MCSQVADVAVYFLHLGRDVIICHPSTICWLNSNPNLKLRYMLKCELSFKLLFNAMLSLIVCHKELSRMLKTEGHNSVSLIGRDKRQAIFSLASVGSNQSVGPVIRAVLRQPAFG